MYCEQCGAKLAPGDKFCVLCGTKVPEDIKDKSSEERTVSTKNLQTEQHETPQEEPTKPLVQKDLDETQELELNEDPTVQPEPVMVFVHEPEQENKTEASAEGIKKLKIAVAAAAVVVTLLLAFLLFLLVSGWSPSGRNARDSALTKTPTVVQNVGFEEQEEDSTSEADGTWYHVSVGKGNRLSLRAQPDEDSRKLDRIDNGTRLKITETRGNWGKTTYTGQTGWVCINQDGDQYVVKE